MGQLAQAGEEHIYAARNDISEILGMMRDLLREFTRLREDPTLDVSGTNPIFRRVVHDIEEVYPPNCNCVCIISNSCGRKLV